MKRIILVNHNYQYFIHVENIISIEYHEYVQYKQWKIELTDRSIIRIKDRHKHADIQSIIDEVIESHTSMCKKIQCEEIEEEINFING